MIFCTYMHYLSGQGCCECEAVSQSLHMMTINIQELHVYVQNTVVSVYSYVHVRALHSLS